MDSVEGVAEQVHEDLAQFAGVALNLRDIPIIPMNLDSVLVLVPEKVERQVQGGVQVDLGDVVSVHAGKRAQIRNDRVDPAGSFGEVVYQGAEVFFDERVIGRGLQLFNPGPVFRTDAGKVVIGFDDRLQLPRIVGQEAGVAVNEVQRILYLMSDPCNQLSEGGHFLCLDQLVLGALKIDIGLLQGFMRVFQFPGALPHHVFEVLVQLLKFFFAGRQRPRHVVEGRSKDPHFISRPNGNSFVKTTLGDSLGGSNQVLDGDRNSLGYPVGKDHHQKRQ